METTFKLKKVYNFNTLLPAILGSAYTTMKVDAIMLVDQAKKYRDVYTLHNSLVGVLPNLPNNIEDCSFILFSNSDGEKIVLANEYIDPSSVSVVTTVNIRIDIPNSNTDDIAMLRQRLLELGINNSNIYTY